MIFSMTSRQFEIMIKQSLFRLLSIGVCVSVIGVAAACSVDNVQRTSQPTSLPASNIMKSITAVLHSLTLSVDYFKLEEVQNQIRYFHIDDKFSERSMTMTLYANYLGGLDEYLSKHPDDGELIAISVSPPAGVRGMGGIAPEEIKDPMLRAQYEKITADNKKRIEAYSDRNSVSKMRTALRIDAERYCARKYGKSHAEQTALRRDAAKLSDLKEFLEVVHAHQ